MMRPRTWAGNIPAAAGATIPQNTAWLSAVATRAANSSSYVGAAAESAVAATSTAMSARSSGRRGTRAVSLTSGSVSTATVTLYPVTSSPTRECDTSRSAAISASSPTGTVSTVT